MPLQTRSTLRESACAFCQTWRVLKFDTPESKPALPGAYHHIPSPIIRISPMGQSPETGYPQPQPRTGSLQFVVCYHTIDTLAVRFWRDLAAESFRRSPCFAFQSYHSP